MRVLIAAALSLTLAGVAAAAPKVETLASYPHGAFLENLTVGPDQTVYFTSYIGKAVMALSPKGGDRVFAALPTHPVGIIRTGSGFIVTAHRTPFTDAPAFMSTNEILFLGPTGAVVRTIPAPDARFLNGLLEVAPDKVLIADSAAGVIWALKPSTGALSVWLKDEALTVDPAVKPFRPGANGLKLRGGRLYISNSSRGALYSVGVTKDGEPRGKVEVFVKSGQVDDFVFDPKGVMFATSHGATLLKITPKGAITKVMTEGCDSCTSAAFAVRGGKRQLIVLTTGNFVEGGDAPARVLALPDPK